MNAYQELVNKLSVLSDVLNDEFSIDVSIKSRFYWIKLKSSNGKSVERKDGGSLLSVRELFVGEIGEGAELKDEIVTALHGYTYVYDAYGSKRHEFAL